MADVSNTHPDITSSRITEWNKVDACSKGEEYVKSIGETYLPKPSGFIQQQDGGRAAYNAYRARASFPELFEPTVSSMVGMIHDKGITVELPDSMEGIMGNEVPLADRPSTVAPGVEGKPVGGMVIHDVCPLCLCHRARLRAFYPVVKPSRAGLGINHSA